MTLISLSRQSWPFPWVWLCLAMAVNSNVGFSQTVLQSPGPPGLDAPPEPPPPWQELSIPKSSFLTGITFDATTRRTEARGSDLWPITWAANGDQFAAFGDGGGFGGTNQKGRVSLGISRIRGGPTDYVGTNVWGGFESASAAAFDGKATGLISIDGVLYMWVNQPQTVADSVLAVSYDGARSWQFADWRLESTQRVYGGSFVNAGRDHAEAMDDFVYACFMWNAADAPVHRPWRYERPGNVVLARAPKTQLLKETAWEWYGGLEESGQASWSSRPAACKPIFEDVNGIKIATMCYQPHLQRYLLTYNPRDVRGNFALFEATHPWGPWHQVAYLKNDPLFSPVHDNRRVSIYHFAPKWWENQGRSFVLVFNVGDDAWNTVNGTLTLQQSRD